MTMQRRDTALANISNASGAGSSGGLDRDTSTITQLSACARRLSLRTRGATDKSRAPPMPAYHLPHMPALPPELIARILQHVVDSSADGWVQALKTCALVCGQWLPLAQHHLFRTLVVIDGHTNRRHFRAFLALLAHPHSANVRYCVRELVLKTAVNMSHGGHSVSGDTVREIAGNLPNLKTLDIRGLPFGPSKGKAVCPTAKKTCTLEKLTIANVRAWRSFGQDVLDVLSAFHHIDELVLDGVGKFKDSQLRADGSSGFSPDVLAVLGAKLELTITHLTLTSVAHSHFFFDTLFSTKPSTLRTLRLACGHTTQIPSFASDLAAFLPSPSCSSLVELHLELTDCFRTSVSVPDDASLLSHHLLPSLSSLPSLHTFSLVVLFPHDDPSARSISSFLSHILTCLPRTGALKRVRLCLDMDAYNVRPAELAPFDWHSPWLARQIDWEGLRRALGGLGPSVSKTMVGRALGALGLGLERRGQGGLEELGFAKRFARGRKRAEGTGVGAGTGEKEGQGDEGGWCKLSEEERACVVWELGQRGGGMGRVLRFFES